MQQGGYSAHLLRLLQILGTQGPSEIVAAKLGRTLDISPNTALTYIALTQTMRLIESIPAWGRTAYNRVSGKPKVCLNDTGLGAALAAFSHHDAEQIGGRESYGLFVEQFVALELLKQGSWNDSSRWCISTSLEFPSFTQCCDSLAILKELPSTTAMACQRGSVRWSNELKPKE